MQVMVSQRQPESCGVFHPGTLHISKSEHDKGDDISPTTYDGTRAAAAPETTSVPAQTAGTCSVDSTPCRAESRAFMDHRPKHAALGVKSTSRKKCPCLPDG